MIESLTNFLKSLTWTQALLWSVGLFVVSFFGSIAMAAWVLIKLPPDYFQDHHHHVFLWADYHPVLRILALFLKNLLGLVLVIVGIILSLPGVPGQGLLTILIGIMLLDFPGKHAMERALVTKPAVKRSINRLRERFGKPPLA